MAFTRLLPRASALLAGIALAACAGSAPPVVNAGDASRAAARWPGTDQAQLEAGRMLYLERCSSCHVPVDPASIAADEWPSHVAEMRERAKLDDDEVARVERYLVTIASRPAT
jgi:mono/diheme cytochrome c family protein